MGLQLLLDMAASGFAERRAFGSRDAAPVTFGSLARLAAGGGSLLVERQARHAVLLGRNGPVLAHLLFAAAHAGIPFVPLNYRLTATQIQGLLAELDSPLVVADEDYLPIVAGRVPSMSVREFQTASRDLAELSEPAVVDDAQPAVLLFTSGTTSKPKIVPLRHENLESYILNTVEFGSAAEADAALVSVPPYHVAGIGSVLSNVYSGRRVVHLSDFAAERWLEVVRHEGITTAMLVPTMLSRIVECLNGRPAETPSLRVISYGGARMPAPLLERALTAFPDTGFVNAYGLTETSSTIALLGPEEHREALAATDPSLRARLGSAGRAVPGIELQIRDGSDEAVGPDTVGELWVRGPQVSGEYLGVGSVLDADGWFPTRDRAWLDADGFLFIEGRSDDTIIRGGENIAPAEIEDVLITHSAVADAAVVGVADEEWGQKLVAVVVLGQGLVATGDEIRQHVRDRLRGSRTPDEVVFRAELPYNPTGKLLRNVIVADLDGSAQPFG